MFPASVIHINEKTSPGTGEGTALWQYYFSQTWLPTVQEVLQADWQDAWHSPQPPFFRDACMVGLLTVLMCFINEPSSHRRNLHI